MDKGADKYIFVIFHFLIGMLTLVEKELFNMGFRHDELNHDKMVCTHYWKADSNRIVPIWCTLSITMEKTYYGVLFRDRFIDDDTSHIYTISKAVSTNMLETNVQLGLECALDEMYRVMIRSKAAWYPPSFFTPGYTIEYNIE